MASVFRVRHAPATVSGVRSTGQGQADPVIRVHSLGEAVRFVANAFANYDISAVAITCGDPSIPRLGSLEVKALWREYGERLTQE
ncbi:hypothetical protein LB577_01680 [Mesorhizobium sp. B283B1A]|uniref:hypothetical protein n=1 Tax=Mesorhizobium TaxID=68287 RepID=UPI00040026C4|nr:MULTISPECIES: hypothetical protein [Mesorhizobium]MCA0045674.1 hypothetical protein [Mesorhizobium sp. B283B1A]UQS67803.1 hypothetical protein M5D98_16375 [Mesorhizobium opportunistum]WJI41477.1 hypothetical protein NL534_15025 [Mesorhizobium opportunistum]